MAGDASLSGSDLSDLSGLDPLSSPLSTRSKSPSMSEPSSSPAPSVLSQASSLTPLGVMLRYLSPLSSTSSGGISPRKRPEPEDDSGAIGVNPDDGAPPAKRRRMAQKVRTTEHLDMRTFDQDGEACQKLIDRLTVALRKKKKIVIIAGAGISVSAGIPDFRSANGLFNTLRAQHKIKGTGKQLFDASVYMHDSSTSSFHDMVRELAHQSARARPTPFHHMLASLAGDGRLLRLYSQNIDGIDTKMGPLKTNVPLNLKAPWPKTIQLHGGLEKMVCSKCSDVQPFDGSLFDGPEAPLCKGCEETDNVRTSHAGKRSHGIGRLRPRMVLYNEYNPDEDAIVNVVKADLKVRPDAVLVVGTSMNIPGVRKIVRDMCRVTRGRKDGFTAWINLDPEPSGADLKDCWDLVVRAKCDDVARLVSLPAWDDSPELPDPVKVDEENWKATARSRKEFQVNIRTTAALSLRSEPHATVTDADPKKDATAPVQVLGMPTPTVSPKMRTALPTKPLFRAGNTRQLSLTDNPPKNVKAPVTRKRTTRKSRQAKKLEEKPTATVATAFRASKPTAGQLAGSWGKRKKDPQAKPNSGLSKDLDRAVYASDFSPPPTALRQEREGRVMTPAERPLTQQKGMEREDGLAWPAAPA